MIDMGMRNKGMGHFEKFGRPPMSQFAQIKKQSPALPENFNEKPRVIERMINELGMKKRLHFYFPGRDRDKEVLPSKKSYAYGNEPSTIKFVDLAKNHKEEGEAR
jgi:hypothetical protein